MNEWMNEIVFFFSITMYILHPSTFIKYICEEKRPKIAKLAQIKSLKRKPNPKYAFI